MKLVYSAQDITSVEWYRQILESNGVTCYVRNYYSSSGIGEIPPIECWPQLFIMDDDRYEDAKLLVNQASVEEGDDWICQHCGEKLPASFEICWKCANSRD